MKLFCETSSLFEHYIIENTAILRDFLSLFTWQRQKTKQFCETSSIFEVDNSKNEASLRDFLRKWQLSAELTASYQCVLRFFPSTSLKYLRLPGKIDARSYEVLHLSRKIIFPKLKIWCSKMQPFWGNQRPDLLTSLMNMSLVLRLPREMHLCRSSSNVPCLPSFLEMLRNPHVVLTFGKVHNPLRLPRKTHLNLQKWSEHVVLFAFWLGNVLRPTTAYTFWTSQLPKVLWGWRALHILTWKRASRHNGVHFFDISTSKSAPDPSVFRAFDFQMRFAPHRRALFRHHNFQKFYTCWLGNVLRATSACTFSTSQLPKVLYMLTWKCASRHTGVQLFISHLTTWLRTRRFSEPTWAYFSTLRSHKSFEKHSVSRLCYLFAHLYLLSSGSISSLIFFLLFFSSLTLPTSAFHLSILLEVWLLNFLR